MKTPFTIITLFLMAMFFATPTFADTSENIFYYYPNTNGYQSVEKHYRDIDILAPQIYTVDFKLELGTAESEDILKFAKKKRMDVMPLVVQSGFDKYLMTRLLDDEEAREQLIEDLIDEAEDRDFIGWQFDFENINHLDRDRYTEFVEQAYKAFKKKKLKLSVAVIPRTTPYDKNSTNQYVKGCYNIGELAKVSDFISLMSYDDPRSLGPVSSMVYIEKMLENTLIDAPAEKLSLGIPMYCWQYELGNPKKIANVTYEISAATQEKYKDQGVFSLYFEPFEAEIFGFVKNGIVNYIWCDNQKSVKRKLDFAKEKGLRGISAWALGQEDPKMWKHF